MFILITLGLLSLILGILFLTSKNALKKLSEAMNKVIVKDDTFEKKHNKIVGVFLLVFAVFLFLVSLKLRH